MPDYTIYHNPRCSKSRQTLALLEQHDISPEIVQYLDTPPDKERLRQLVAMLGITPRELLRTSEAAYTEMGLDDKALSDARIIEAMAAEPKLIERPIVVSGGRAVLGRPPENVLELI